MKHEGLLRRTVTAALLWPVILTVLPAQRCVAEPRQVSIEARLVEVGTLSRGIGFSAGNLLTPLSEPNQAQFIKAKKLDLIDRVSIPLMSELGEPASGIQGFTFIPTLSGVIFHVKRPNTLASFVVPNPGMLPTIVKTGKQGGSDFVVIGGTGSLAIGTRKKNQVPVLSDIPLFGSLFNSESKIEDLVVLVKPTVIPISEDSPIVKSPATSAKKKSPEVWFTVPAQNAIGRLLPDGSFQHFIPPTPNSEPSGIAVDKRGNVWFTERTGNKIGKIDRLTGAITEIPLPTPDSRPLRIVTDAKGNVFFTQEGSNQIGILARGTTLHEFPLPEADSRPSGLVLSLKNTLSVTLVGVNKVANIKFAGL